LTDEQYKSFRAGNLYVNVHSDLHKSGEGSRTLPAVERLVRLVAYRAPLLYGRAALCLSNYRAHTRHRLKGRLRADVAIRRADCDRTLRSGLSSTSRPTPRVQDDAFAESLRNREIEA